MARDERFEPDLGRMRAPRARSRRYLARILAATNLARGSGPAARGRASGGPRMRSGGRTGGSIAQSLSGFAPARRVIFKARIVRLAGKSTAAVAHLRYLTREGTTRDGDRGQLYGPESDSADGREFLARGAHDRHQFRFIVSAEDGAEYEDLKPLTRRLMAQAEIDLGTRLDWVAVDHFNTGHPHTHILLRGVDQNGHDLVIPRNYIAVGFRERAAELVDLDLGPISPRQALERARRDMTAERVTELDRTFAAEAEADGIVTAHANTSIDQTLRAGRLSKLHALGLARPLESGRWRLEDGFTDTLQRLGERGDIIRTMQRAFTEAGQARALTEQAIYDPRAPGTQPLVGRVLEHGLADEHRDQEYLIVDGVDGRTHYVRIGAHAIDQADDQFGGGKGVTGATVRVAPRAAGVRKADRVIAEVAAANGGRYDGEAHRRFDPKASQSLVEAHIARLEAVRDATRAVERDAAGSWSVPQDYLARVENMEAARLRYRLVEVTMLAAQSPTDLCAVEGVTWLDQEIVSGMPTPVRAAGFGVEVRRALEARRAWLAGEALFPNPADAAAGARIIDTLRARDLSKAAANLSRELGLPYAPASDDERVTGVYRRRIDLASGRFALVERAHDFTLLPWRPSLESARDRQIRAEAKGGGISWTLGRSRSGPGRTDL